MIWLIVWLVVSVAITAGYSAMRTWQKRRETYNSVFTA